METFDCEEALAGDEIHVGRSTAASLRLALTVVLILVSNHVPGNEPRFLSHLRTDSAKTHSPAAPTIKPVTEAAV